MNITCTTEQAIDIIHNLVDVIGPGFHPDTAIAEYIAQSNGQLICDKEDSDYMQSQLDMAINCLSSSDIDPSLVALEYVLDN